MRIPVLASLFLALTLAAGPLAAQPPKPAAAESQAVSGLPADSITEHTIGEDASRITYTATAGSLPLTNAKTETAAKVFYTAYAVKGENRPVTFVFNGGPGAASAFLHIGAMGPRVLDFTPDGSAAAEPVRLVDNPDHWLGFTDLVFVDPPGTGFSRTMPGDENDKAYTGVDRDADAMTGFIRLWLTRHGRALAPLYIAGESYGGFRAVLLANRLLKSGHRVNGILLISPALEMSMLRGDEFQLLPLALDLPSIAASHIEMTRGLDAPLDAVADAERFALSEYLVSLASGRTDRAVTSKLSELTGLPAEIVARHRNRVSTYLFSREYRRETGRSLSGYDGAISAPMPRPGENIRVDPILDKAVTVLSPAMKAYTAAELGYKTDLEYTLLNRDVNGKWDFGTTPQRQGFAGSLDELQEARTQNPALKVFVAHGYTDLVTPYAVSDYLISQLDPIDGAAPIVTKVYRGGHMMYMRAPSRKALTEDARAVYANGRQAANENR